MKAQILKPGISAALGLLLTIPAAYFIFISLLKYLFGMPLLFDTTQPLLESLDIKESMGWNINLLIVFGPLLALLFNVTSILSFNWHATQTDIGMAFQIEKRWSNILAIILSASCILILFFYLLGENCQ